MVSLINTVHGRLAEGVKRMGWGDSHQALLRTGLGVVGAYAVMSCVRKGGEFVFTHFLRPAPSLTARYGGSWAVVTGASAGIGAEIAKSLVKAGVNVVLMARDVDRLTAFAEELKLLNGSAQVRVVSCDAADPHFKVLLSAVQDLDISLLVNNVGVHNDIPANTQDLSKEEVDRIIAVNCNFQVNLTAALVPQLIKHQAGLKRRSAQSTTILNVSSLTSQMLMPMLSVYAATKAFEEHWSAGLAAELEPHGVEVLCVRPGLTVSRMSGIKEPALFCPSAADMARSILSKLGCGKHSIAPYWPHALLDWVNQMVPARIAGVIVRKMHQEKRDLLLLKKE